LTQLLVRIKTAIMTRARAPHLFIFGVGYTARALAARLIGDGWRVSGTVRESARANALRDQGIAAHVFDRAQPLADAASLFAGVTHVLSSVPPDDIGDAVLDRHARDLASCRALEWLGYLSTTGVYGDRGGGWVDETDARQPSGARGGRRVAAEDGWLELHRRHGLPVHIFRLAGIYGPGRNALAQLRAGTARRIDKPGQVFSRIHVDDIVAVLRASMARPSPGAAYNVADDLPAPPQDVVAFAAELLDVAPPPLVPFAEAELSAMARSFYDDSKRVRNDRIKSELGVRLAYPDYRAGLCALLATER
jgi:nucleoside-diphosphate-sugar epimerase